MLKKKLLMLALICGSFGFSQVKTQQKLQPIIKAGTYVAPQPSGIINASTPINRALTNRSSNVTLDATPNVNQPQNQTVCNNSLTSAVNFTGTVPGTNFRWTNSNTTIGLAASGTGAIPAFTATNTSGIPQIATITVTPSLATNSGGSGVSNILIVYADQGAANLQAALAAVSGVTQVDLFDARSDTPTVDLLNQYSMVVTFSNFAYQDNTATGNNMVAYMNNGGIVVSAAFSSYTTYGMQGDWINYDPFENSSSTNFSWGGLGAYDASSSIMNNVSNVNAYFRTINTLSTGATLVASWDDGSPLLAYKGRAVSISGHFGDSVGSTYFNGDFGQMIVNSGNFISGGSSILGTPASFTITVKPAVDPIPSGTYYVGTNTSIQNVFGYNSIYSVYAAATGGSALAGTTVLNNGTYYATQTQNGCESIRTAISIVTYNLPTISSPTCGSRLSSITGAISAVAVPNATNYLFEVTGNGATQSLYSNTNSFNLTQLQGTIPFNTTYSIRVAAGFNGQYGAFGSACAILTPATPNTTQVISSQCGTTLAAMTSPIYCGQIVGAQTYRFEFTAAGVSRSIDSPINSVQISNLVGGALNNTAYTVRVAAQIAGSWQAYGFACTITTSAASTQIRTNQCGTTLANKWAILYCSTVTGATAYRFEWSNGGSTLTYNSSQSNMQLGNYTGWALNTTYSVRVAAQFGGTWQAYGSACNVKTPATMAREMSEIATTLSIKAVPNPFETAFVLMAQGGNQTPFQVAVYDMLGKQVEQFSVEANELENRPLGTNYTSGIYNVMISEGDNQQVVRIIKK
jgi:hypothetical protein